MKKTIALTLAIVMLVTVLALPALASNPLEADDPHEELRVAPDKLQEDLNGEYKTVVDNGQVKVVVDPPHVH